MTGNKSNWPAFSRSRHLRGSPHPTSHRAVRVALFLVGYVPPAGDIVLKAAKNISTDRYSMKTS